MMLSPRLLRCFAFAGILQFLAFQVHCKDILQLSSFSGCIDEPEIFIDRVDIQYNKNTRAIDFDIAGRSLRSENVTATLQVAAYGKNVYTNQFNPCDSETYIAQLCPVPVGNFSGASSQVIPDEFASKIPSIAFPIPDIALQATVQLKTLDGGRDVGCVVADLSNGKSVDSQAVTYVAVGIAAATLVLTGLSSILSGAGGGNEPGARAAPSPSLPHMIWWFQSVATSGMLSVNYPALYRRFTERFAFSTGLISWTTMQSSIDSFRSRTGGNTTIDNVETLQNTTLVFGDSESSSSLHVSRSVVRGLKFARQFSFVGDTAGNGTEGSQSGIMKRVSGIEAYVEQTGIVQKNAFMTVFLIGCIVCMSIVVAILLFKTVLEIWALCGRFPKALVGFRKHYWGTAFRTIVLLIYIFFGQWVMYCIFQFKTGDSWAATLLAGLTLAVFSGVLIFFIVLIIRAARKYIKTYGNPAPLFEEKETWLKYSLFYHTYRHSTWWFFVTIIAYNFVKYFLLAALNGEGLAQTISVLAVESALLVLFVFIRPFERKTDNVVNIMIQLVQTLLVAGTLTFVHELKVERSTQTIMGFALIILTSVLTGILVLLMIYNAVASCCKDNPHRKRRKEAEKQKRESAALMAQHRNHHPYGPSDGMVYTRQSRVVEPAKVPLYTNREV